MPIHSRAIASLIFDSDLNLLKSNEAGKRLVSASRPLQEQSAELAQLVERAFAKGDRFTVLSDGFYDFFGSGLKLTTFGATLTKPQIGMLYAGVRNISGPIDSTVLASSLTYRMSDKWLTTVGTSFDFVRATSDQLTRRPPATGS